VLAGEQMNATGGLEPYPLTPALASQVRALMTQLGLVYGVVHLRIALNGQPVFSELDPSGNWLAVEEQTDLPITQAMARLFVGHERTHLRPNPAVFAHGN
jgi:hypothetical protein